MEGENYPYNLKKGLTEPVPFDKIANISESKLYYHFESLTKQGLIAPIEVIKEDSRPDKHVFSITDEGRAALPKKIYDVFEKATKMSEIIIGLMFIEYVDIEKVMAIIQVKKMALESKLQDISMIYNNIQAPDHMAARVHLANNYFTDMLLREIDWFERVMELLQNENDLGIM